MESRSEAVGSPLRTYSSRLSKRLVGFAAVVCRTGRGTGRSIRRSRRRRVRVPVASMNVHVLGAPDAGPDVGGWVKPATLKDGS